MIEALRKDGIEKGICHLGKEKIRHGVTLEELANLFLKGIDFCICEDYPTLTFLRENFKGKCTKYGIFIDDDIINLKNKPLVVLNGACRAFLEYDDYSVSRLYVRHNTEAAINASGNAILTIDAFNKSKLVVAVSGESAIVNVNLYGDSSIKSIGNGIGVKYINKKTY